MTERPTQLRRSLSMPQVALYGLGNILGAGIYVLIGEIAGIAGNLAPFAFLFAAAVAALTAFSFAEFSSRYPVSGGAALYVHKGFNRPGLTVLVGVLMVTTGVVSSATITRGFVGYLDVFVQLPSALTIVVLVTGLCALACWGIRQSVATAAAITLLEIAGLLLIIGVAIVTGPPAADSGLSTAASAGSSGIWAGLLGGSFLAFYAYIGFEDIVNVAEEVKSPQRAMPKAILIALVTATLLYAAATFAALQILSPASLAASDAPLADVYSTATGASPWFISLISLFAVVNGALIQIIMCSRIAFGLSQEDLLPKVLGQLNPRTQTPINATVGVSILIAIAALSLSTETLARFTTTILLLVFILVNLSLLRVKQAETETADAMVFPRFVPILGLLASGFFLIGEIVL